MRQQALNKKTSSLAHLFTTLYLIDSKTVGLQRTSDKHPIVTEIKTGNKPASYKYGYKYVLTLNEKYVIIFFTAEVT